MSPSRKTGVKLKKAARAGALKKKVSRNSMNDKSAANPSVDASVKDANPSREAVSSVNNTSANAIRAGFLDFFAKRDHQVVPSAPPCRGN